ncbi:ABC transporter [Vibrio panuliri]|uniref:ABC transporter n=1 Tax=Vibrio panuliri TaxID=1381081 RepID=A0A1Q9HMX8_9VIBR|nr:ABC transporter permease [Vibrio panuliri]OLQ92080.1 ABC transporter [Vibrio panuliri]
MAKINKRSTLQIWGDVIFAIFLREIKSNFSDKFGISWALISPMIMITAMVLIRNPFDGGDTHGMPTVFFVVFGVVLVQFFLGTFEKTANAIQKNKPLYAFRQVQPISSVLAIGGFELVNKIALVVLLTLLAYFFQMEMKMADPLALIFTVIRVWFLAVALGTIFSLAACYVPEVQKIKVIITRPMFFISGIFFSLQDIPTEYWPYLIWNPLLHAIELARFEAYPPYGSLGVSEFYLDISTLVAVTFALCCYQISWKQAISR